MFLARFWSETVGWCHLNWMEGHIAEDEHEAGMPDANAPAVALLGGDSYDAGGRYLSVKTPYTRTLRGRLIEETKEALQAAYERLCAAYGSRGRLYRHRLTSGYVWVPARLIAMPTTINHASLYRYGGHYALDLELRFQIYQGLWNGRRHGAEWVFPAPSPLDVLGGDLVWGYDAAADTFPLNAGFTVVNGGNREQRAVVMRVEAHSTIPTLTITNTTTGTAWTYSGGLVNNDVLVVDTAEHAVTKNGASAFWNSSFVQQFDWSGAVWFELRPGANAITSSAGTSADTISFLFTDSHAA